MGKERGSGLIALLAREWPDLKKKLEEIELDETASFAEEYDAVVAQGVVNEVSIINCLAAQYGLETVDLDTVEMEEGIRETFPVTVVRQHLVFPISVQGSTLHLASCNPSPYVADDLHFLTGHQINLVLASKSKIVGAIRKYYPGLLDSSEQESDTIDPLAEMADVFPGVMEEEPVLERDEEGIDIDELEKNIHAAPVVRLVNLILTDGIRRGASEIHIEPYEKQFSLRYRLNGKLIEVMNPPLRLRNAIVARIKIMAELNLSERRKPQNGKILLVLGRGKECLFYVSILPVLHGEKIVLRLRDRMKAPLRAKDFSISTSELDELKRELGRPGIKVIYGAARTGKSELLRLLCREMSEEWKHDNVIAIGDVDVDGCGVDNVNCVFTNPTVGLTEAQAMKEACFGQSADVVMMDGRLEADTAKAALDAGLSGRVVILTIAGGSAKEAHDVIAKLTDNDARLDLALNLFLGVKLPRRLCPDCSQPYADQVSLEEFFLPRDMPAVEKLRIPAGCVKCHKLGYVGQIGVCEMTKDVSGQTLGATMAMKLRRLLEEGSTSLTEVIR